MKEIKCPNCQTVFKIDDDIYYEILKQIKDQEIEKERTVLEQKYEKEMRYAFIVGLFFYTTYRNSYIIIFIFHFITASVVNIV